MSLPKANILLTVSHSNGRLNSIFLFGKNAIKIHAFFSCLGLPCCLQINHAEYGSRSQITIIVPQDLRGSEKTPSVSGGLQMNRAALCSTGSCTQRLDGLSCCAAINLHCGHILGLSRQHFISLCRGFQTSPQMSLLMPRLNFNYALTSRFYDKWL